MTSITLKKANELFRQGHLKEAMKVYEELKNNKNLPTGLVEKNIALLNRKLNLIKLSEENFIKYEKTAAYAYVESFCENFCYSENISASSDLVSIVIPARNCSSYIENTISSLRNQSHKNIEIIVVDDFSTDDTEITVNKLTKEDARIKYVKLNSNLGTYFARSYGISVAQGEYVTFQDADDFSHKDRIKIHLSLAKKKDALVVTSNFIRFDIETGEAINFHGKVQHYGFITTFAKKSLFEEIGSFDLTTRGGDAEFSLRIKRFVEKTKVQHISIPTYLATDMPGSLSHGEIDRAVNDKKAALSFARAKYSHNFSAIAQTFKKDELESFFKFPMLRSPYSIPKGMANSNINHCKFLGSLLISKNNIVEIQRSIQSICNQVDFLYIICTDNKIAKKIIDEIDEFSSKTKLIESENTITQAESLFLPIEDFKKTNYESAIIFGFNDDTYYPPDYTHSLFQRLREHDFLAAVGVSGVSFAKNTVSDKHKDEEEIYYHEYSRLDQDIRVDILNTSHIAFSTDIVSNLSKEFKKTIKSDFELAKALRKGIIPLYCVSHPGDWLKRNSMLDNNTLHSNKSEWKLSVIQEKLKDQSEFWKPGFAEQLFYKNIIKPNLEDKNHSRCFKNHFTTEHLNAWTIKFPDSSIYRITINIEKSKNTEFTLTLKNARTGQSIYEKNLEEKNTSFLCNAAKNNIVIFEITPCSSNNIKYELNIETQRLFDACAPIIKNHNDKTIFACIATYPPREECLKDVVDSILPQVDNLYIYLNRYSTPPKFFDELYSHPNKIESVEYLLDTSGRPKASGKFRWLDYEGYVFTLDDDIIYPENYFEHLIGWIEKFKRKAFIGVHGITFEKEVSFFHGNSKSSIKEKVNFSKGLEKVKQVHLIGTGTLAFHSSLIKPFRNELYYMLNPRAGHENANDECLAVFSRKKNIPMYIVPRRENWLKANKKMKYGIYEEHFNDPALAESVLELLGSGNPWPECP